MKKSRWIFAGVLAVAAVAAFGRWTLGQESQKKMPSMGMPPMIGMMGGGSPSVTATEKGVYVVVGNRIYRLDPDTLAVRAKAALPSPLSGSKEDTTP